MDRYPPFELELSKLRKGDGIHISSNRAIQRVETA
jgi:hypothetical protein